MRHPSCPPRYDVAVVGARAAGAATALLARHGMRVLLKRGRYGADTLSTHVLMRGGVLQFARWGLLDDVIAAGTPPIRRPAFRYADEIVAVPVTPSHGVGALYAPRRTVRDPILVDAALRASATPARIGRGSLAVLRELVAATAPELTGRLAAARPPTVVRAFPGRPGHVRTAWGPGWPLVGDAADYKGPLGAHGLTDALRDAELLARALVAVVAVVEDVPAHVALADYQAKTECALRRSVRRRRRHQRPPVDQHRDPGAFATIERDEVDALAALPVPPLRSRAPRDVELPLPQRSA